MNIQQQLINVYIQDVVNLLHINVFLMAFLLSLENKLVVVLHLSINVYLKLPIRQKLMLPNYMDGWMDGRIEIDYKYN